MIKKNIIVKGAQILILGATFKPDVNDIRNSKVKDLADELKNYDCLITFFDPMLETSRIWGYQNIKENEFSSNKKFDFIIKAVPHKKLERIKFDYEI